MAEVTSGFHSLSSKKPPGFGNHGFTISSSSSSSSKHIYDDVFARPTSTKFKSSEFSSFGDDDYAEIFRSSKSGNGVWQSSSSSIPIFSLPDSEHRGGDRGGVDYLGVFGGGGDDNLDLPDGGELFDQMKKKAKTSGSASIPRNKDQIKEATTSHIPRDSENGQRPTRGFSQSFDSVKHFEHQIEMTTYEPNGATHVVHVHANPHPPREVGPSKKRQTNGAPIITEDTEVRMDVYLEKEGKHSRNTSSQLGANDQKREHDAGFQMAPHLSELNSTATPHETHQNTATGPSKQLKEGGKVQFNKDNAATVTPRSTSLHEVGPTQKNQTNRTPVTKDSVELDTDIGLANKRVEPSRNTCLELKKGGLSRNTNSEQGAKEWQDEYDDDSRRASCLSNSNPTAGLHDTCQVGAIAGPSKGVKKDAEVEYDIKHDPMQVEPSDLVAKKQNGEHDAIFEEASDLNRPSQNGTSRDTFQVSSVTESSKDVKDDVKAAAGPDLGKKLGRHARMTSLDLGDHKQPRQADAGSQQKAHFGSSYSFDASHDPFVAHIKVQPSKVVPSSSLPQFFSVENRCKVSENSSCKNSENYMCRGSVGSPPSLDEQLDVNSVAAISAATLQRAIEEAERRIRLAKEFLEREGQGNGKTRFKDTLKLKVGKENNNVNEIDEIYEYQQKNVQHQPQIESTMQTCHHSERKSILETVPVAPVSGGLKQSAKYAEPTEAKSAKVSKSIEKGDRREGGEWEASKHLNQLISGVKNRIASFMAWQSEPEQKEEPKETEATRKSQQQSQSEQELKDAEVFETKETEINQYASASACETKDRESKTGFIPKTIELDENELMPSNSVVQEKAVRKLGVVPDYQGPTRTNFLFFTFTGQRFWDHTHLEGGEERKTEGTEQLGVQKRKEKINEMKDEQIQAKSEEANLERLDNICMSQDCGKSLQGSSNGESDGILEELCSVIDYDGSKLICEEERLDEEHGVDKRLNDKCGDDTSEFVHEDNHTRSLSEEFDNVSEEFDNGSEFTYQENERLNDECGGNQSEYNHGTDRTINEECREDRSEFTQQENRRLNEESGDNSCEFTHKEGIRLHEEHGVDQSNSTCEENNDIRMSEKGETDRSDFPCELINNARMNEEYEEEPISSCHCPEASIMTIETDDEREEYEEAENAENQLGDREPLEEADFVGEIEKRAEAIEETNGRQENERDQGLVNDIEEVSQQMNGWEENRRNQSRANHAEETENRLADQGGCILADDECEQTESVFLSNTVEASGMDGSNSGIEERVISDEENERMMEIDNSSCEPGEVTVFPKEESEKPMEETNPSSEPKKDMENPAATQEVSELMGEGVLASFSTENTMESHGVVHLNGADVALPCENFVLHESETDVNCRQTDIDGDILESESEEICENPIELLNESGDNVDVGEAPNVSDRVEEKCSFEAVHRRRRWFENSDRVINADRPGILEVEGDGTNLAIDQEVLEESDLAGSVEIHADKQENEAPEVTTGTETGSALNQEDYRVNIEATHKRRRWFVNIGEGIPEPPSLFGGIKLTPKMDPEIVNESQPHAESEGFVAHICNESGDTLNVAEAEVVVTEEKNKQSVEATPRRKRWFENENKLGPNQQQRRDENARIRVDMNPEYKEIANTEKSGEEKDDMHNKTKPLNEVHVDLDAVNRRKKEKEKERIVVERAIREARERAFAEARERARRDAVERPKMEGSQRVGSGGQDKPDKDSSEATSAADKASMEAKLKVERAAVERATAEARERALQRALSEKASHSLREPAGRHQPERSASFDPKYHSSSSYTKFSDPSNKGEKIDEADGESVQRHKARLERQKRTMERATKALEEKNKRDLQAQKEQAARNMLADTLDAEVRRWSSGKEGNLRALLSTLQYILGSDCGWQAISLTDLVPPTAVRKAYKKATLCVHPDKLQQRGATIQQKYICEKVFDLLKEAWSKFNPDQH